MKTSSTSRPRCRGLCTLLLCVSALWVMPTGAQTPTPITVTGPALRRADTAPNDLNLFPGDSIVISADTVMPSGAEGTTATAQTTNLSTGLPYGPIVIGPNPQTTDLYEFRRSISYDPNLTGPWTVTFTNASTVPTSNTVITPSLVGVAAAPYANSVRISGSSLNPTFTWSFQTGVDAVDFLIYEKGVHIDPSTVLLVPGGFDNLFTHGINTRVNPPPGISPMAGSYTLGYTLTPGTHWAVGFRALSYVIPPD